MSQEKGFSMRSWFEQLFGFKESIEKVYENIEVTENPDHKNDFVLKSSKIDRAYKIGNFQVRSSDRKTYDLSKAKSSKKGTLNIIKGYGSRSKHFELIDILAMQSIKKWNGATYLAASNFNCLEFVSSHQTAENGITSYYADPTQGPYAALACGPAILYRNYFVEHPDGEIGQLKQEINLLDKTPIKVIHGYAQIKNDKDFKSITNSTGETVKPSDFDWKDPSIWQVGVHRNCEVVMTRYSNRGFTFAPPNQISHHVYAAAFNFCGDVKGSHFTYKISEELLTASYRATILAAWENSLRYSDLPGSNKLSLTLLGGGVFNNPYEIICEAIGNNVDLIIESGLDAYITCFSKDTFDQVYNLLSAEIEKTGGRIVDTNDDESCSDLID